MKGFQAADPRSRGSLDHSKRAAGKTAPPLTGIKALLVDDDPDTRTLVAEVLRARGASVWLAGSTPLARELLRERNFEILISDLQMPGESGLTLIRRLRAQGVTTPAIALTGYNQPERRIQALAAGYNVYLCKPVDPPELVLFVMNLAGCPSREPVDAPSVHAPSYERSPESNP